jgi:hypothetical protein
MGKNYKMREGGNRSDPRRYHPRHAQLEDPQVLGSESLNPDPNGRCVRWNRRTLLEGHLESIATELRDGGTGALRVQCHTGCMPRDPSIPGSSAFRK